MGNLNRMIEMHTRDMEYQGDSVHHLPLFLHKFTHRIPFSIIRPGDGEYSIMMKKETRTQDGWTFVEEGTLAQDLHDITSWISGVKDMYVGIPCKDCNTEHDVHSWYKETWKLQPSQVTYSSLFCDANWMTFSTYLKESHLPFHYIGPGERTDSPLNVLNRWKVKEQLVNTWDQEKHEFLRDLYGWVGHQIRTTEGVQTFLFSAGPLSKIVIPILHHIYPGHQYVDVGSALDFFMKPSTNRLYIQDHDEYRYKICDFVRGHASPPQDITAILTLYKRPHVLVEQIAALRNQTRPPKQIILWINRVEGYECPESIRSDPSILIMDCNRNMGVWARFAAGLLADTEFVCVLDDDTIPGRKWFENCLHTMKQVNGLLGTIGWRFLPELQYTRFEPRIGWDGPNFETQEVDMVCHAWFLRRAWLPELFRIVPDYTFLFRTGEDMGLSYACQQLGIKTYVPPHPPFDFDMYGSLPEKAVQYGTESVAICLNEPNFDEMFTFYKNKGFRFMCNRV